MTNATVRMTCHKLLQAVRFGFDHSEAAAFVVRNADGSLTAIRWPVCGEADRQQWFGSLPAGTVALLHTHRTWLPEPSRIDQQTARRTHIPVYVVTLHHIVKTDGEISRSVADEWDN